MTTVNKLKTDKDKIIENLESIKDILVATIMALDGYIRNGSSNESVYDN